MIAELGVFSLILALLFASLLVIVPTYGLWFAKPKCVATAPYYVGGQVICVGLAYLCLTWCFLTDDFSVQYVLANSSLLLPWFYKACALWGGHEGSMLLWVSLLSGWMALVTWCRGRLEEAFSARVLVILGALSVGFLLFLLLTSNPFLRQFQVLNTSGMDLNPLLQDPGFLFHPPMLYMGYVGFAVAFAFALAVLWMGRLESAWAKWTRPWTLAAWCCLTVGITLGSWWAYRELGWGGFWFWDPVENASFMPWLAGTALLHSLAVSEKRQQFRSWTLLLAITVFSLSLIGTFLVRSGILTSVHAFAVDPQRGLFILLFLGVVIGGALSLFAWRATALTSLQHPAWISRETALLLNNVLLSAMMLTVLTGTVYPLLVDGLGLGKLSVGAPYFNAVFVPFMIPLLLFMGLGGHLQWQRDQWVPKLKRLIGILGFSVAMPVILLVGLGYPLKPYPVLALMLASWVLLSTVVLIIKQKQRGFGMTQSLWGMILAHMGVAVTVIGVSLSTGYGVQKDVRLAPGDTVQLAGYTVQFLREYAIHGSNYEGIEAAFEVRHGKQVQQIFPQKRRYKPGQMTLTEAAIDVNPWRDLYVALGEPLDNQAWSVRVYWKPFVRWIWAGGFFIFFGGVLALTDPRYRRKRNLVLEQSHESKLV